MRLESSKISATTGLIQKTFHKNGVNGQQNNIAPRVSVCV